MGAPRMWQSARPICETFREWSSRVQYSIVQCSMVQNSIVQHSMLQHSITYIIVQYNLQYSRVQCSIVQYSIVQYSIVQYSIVQPGPSGRPFGGRGCVSCFVARDVSEFRQILAGMSPKLRQNTELENPGCGRAPGPSGRPFSCSAYLHLFVRCYYVYYVQVFVAFQLLVQFSLFALIMFIFIQFILFGPSGETFREEGVREGRVMFFFCGLPVF